ncbi:hypothetical protein CWC17_07745 [Pseudoalteromonas sp. S3785]|uniref:hypothetical protein n=1 Tax=Pseudoalteromonas sp. S3785 TaxID=579545 RepID=UPI00110A55A5|nr:hypothetical protein [Pseudoalteromonas sp. S3785]TMO74843.1 hypothetical protein CWC17_07745 [Pseudoalteromonas sp. S3785]
MDALEKLAERNRQQTKIKKDEKFLTYFVLLGLLPFYADLIYSKFVVGLEFPESFGYFLLSLAGNCIFAFPVLGMGSLLLFPRLLKLFTLIGIQTWFAYFWVFHDLTWVGFFPLVIVYITFYIQLPKIKQRAAEEDGI